MQIPSPQMSIDFDETAWLRELATSSTPVRVFLRSGIRLEGRLVKVSTSGKAVLFSQPEKKPMLIYTESVSTVVPQQAIKEKAT